MFKIYILQCQNIKQHDCQFVALICKGMLNMNFLLLISAYQYDDAQRMCVLQSNSVLNSRRET
jgi:hypothetical protein